MSVILIVDDNEKNRYSLRKMLAASSYEVIEAANGAEALESARRRRPDLIISDILMPQMDGFALCRKCKSDEQLRNIPFIFYTATYTDPRDEALGLKLGAERFLIKPIEGEEFISIVREVLKANVDGKLTVSPPPIEDKAVFYRLYNEALIRKLEEKMLELKKLNLSLTKSEERFRALIEATTEGVVFHHQGLIVDANPAMVSMFGYKNASEMIGHELLEFIAPESRDIVTKQIQSKNIQPYEAMGLRKNGTTFDVEVCAWLYIYNGRIVRVESIRDISARKKAEKMYSTIVRTAMDGFWLTDNEGRFLEVNEAYCQMIGYSREELLKMGIRDLESAESPEETAQHMQRIKEIGYDRFETLHRRKDGRLITLDISVNYLPGNGGRGFVFLRDITERKKTEEEARLLKTIALGIGEAEDLNSAVAFVLRRVCEATGWVMGEVWFPSRDNSKMECYPVWYSSVPKLEKFRRISQDFVFKPGEGLPGTVWLTKKPLWIVEAGAAANFLRREAALRAGLKAVVGVPVLGHNQVIMVMVFFLFKPRTKDQHMVDLIAAVAAQIGLLIERKKAEEERERLQAQLIQARKMEAIGQLSGGVAHDFNNQLGIIIGQLDYMRSQLSAEDKALLRVETATQATLRCIDLTRQLLAFSRQQTKETVVTDLNREIAKMETFIARSVTPAINVQNFPGKGLWLVAIDPGEFHDAILNLIINARDAMPKGGKLIIETTNKQLDEHYAALSPGVDAGEYVEVMLSDTGCGMDAATLERAFEPFFTTKPEGKGTGLGLAMVYGFAKRHGGHVKLYSEPGVGTTVRMYLPRAKAAQEISYSAEEATEAPLPAGRGETILIVDDEIDMLELADQYLKELGYRTLLASSAAQAMSIIEKEEGIALLFTDVVMSGGTNGYQLAEAACQRRPHLKVLLTSGFTFAANGQARFSARLLPKPYRKDDLARCVRSALDKEMP